MRHVDPLGEHHAVAHLARVVAVGDDVERAAVVAAEHAGEAAAIGGHGLQDAPALGDPDAVLVGDVGVPDGALGVEADAVGRGALAELSPDAPVDHVTRGGDRERGEPVRVRLGDDQRRPVRRHGHPVGEPDVLVDDPEAAVGVHDADDPGLGLLPRHRAGHVDPRAPCRVDDDLVPAAPGRAVGREVRPHPHAVLCGDEHPAVGQPVDRERQPGHPSDRLPAAVRGEGEDLTREPVAHPEPAVVPTGRLAHLDPGREHLRHVGSHRRCRARTGAGAAVRAQVCLCERPVIARPAPAPARGSRSRRRSAAGTRSAPPPWPGGGRGCAGW